MVGNVVGIVIDDIRLVICIGGIIQVGCCLVVRSSLIISVIACTICC